MQHRALFAAAIALVEASGVLGQAPTTTSNPLNAFIGAAGSAVGVISSAQAKETSASSSATPTSTSAAASSSTAAPAKPSGLSSRNRLIIIIVCVVVGVLLLAALAGCVYCCLARRRRRRRAVTPLPDEEVSEWRRPSNPGRAYSPVHQHGPVHSMEQQPTVPLMAAVGRPPTQEHPAYRHENPFVPVPPLPRKSAPNSRPGLTDGTVAGEDAYIGAPRSPGNRLRKSSSRSRSSSGVGLNDSYTQLPANQSGLPTHNDANRPPTPFGLSTVSAPQATGQRGPNHRYSGIGQPYSDMHVHHLVNDKPSHALHEAPYAVADPVNQRYSTPPSVPSRSPNRRSQFRDSTYKSSASDSNNSYSPSNSGSGDSWRTSQMGVVPSPLSTPWDDREHRYSGSQRERSYSRSPRQSMSGTPRPSQSGMPKRLRFSDFDQHNDDIDGHRYSQGVGQAM